MFSPRVSYFSRANIHNFLDKLFITLSLSLQASFMVKFGYMDDDVIGKNRGPLDPNSEEFRASIRNLQRFGNIPVTGRIDAATIKLINTDRCGMKDPPPDAAGRFSLQGTRWKRTVRYI